VPSRSRDGMSEILKGNFQTKNSVTPDTPADRLEDRFEREALKRLGGSIAFVSKQRVVWGDEDESPKPASQRLGAEERPPKE
jgi:hypothetical protein